MSFELKAVLWGGGAILLILVLAAVFGTDEHSASLSNTSLVPPSVTNDAELLLFRCGAADIDDSTEDDNPRPPIPTRMITYKKAHLRFAYVPGGDSRVGDPPPYKWKFVGIVDTQIEKAVTAKTLESVLRNRLPCDLPSNH